MNEENESGRSGREYRKEERVNISSLGTEFFFQGLSTLFNTRPEINF